MSIKVYITALERFLFKFIWFSTHRYTHYKWVNWCSCAMLLWKKVVIIFLHQKWLGLAFMDKYHSKLLMLFNLAFLMKCKNTKCLNNLYIPIIIALRPAPKDWKLHGMIPWIACTSEWPKLVIVTTVPLPMGHITHLCAMMWTKLCGQAMTNNEKS